MNDPVVTVILAALTALPPTLMALAALIASLRNSKAIQNVHSDVNSRMDQLIKAAHAAGFAAGVKSETDKRVKE
jgi:hypothetical protein